MDKLEKETKLTELNDKLNIKRTEIEAAIEEGNLTLAEELMADAKAIKKEIEDLEKLEVQDTAEEKNKEENGVRSMTKRNEIIEDADLNTGEDEVRANFLHYISTGELRAEGLKTDSNAVLIPKDIATEVIDYTDDVSALSNLVQVKEVKNGQGEIAFFDGKSVSPLTEVAELEQNPMVGIQQIKKVGYKAKTYRGYYPVSKESIEDGVGALTLVKDVLREAKKATENKLILDELNKKQATEVTTFDDVKKALNITLAPKYKKQIVVSQSVFNWLDTLKDGNNRYLLQDSISAQSGKQINGIPVEVFEDEMIGETTMYVGDMKGAVALIVRSIYEAQWTSYMQFAECLMIAVRLDCKSLNPNAVVKLNVAAAKSELSL